MKFKITSDGTTTRVFDAETGREFPTVAVKFEQASIKGAGGWQPPLLTLTLGGPECEVEIEGEIPEREASQEKPAVVLTRGGLRGRHAAQEEPGQAVARTAPLGSQG